MIINHDHSYVNALDNEFVARGYVEDDLFSIRLTYEYTQEQKEEKQAHCRFLYQRAVECVLHRGRCHAF